MIDTFVSRPTWAPAPVQARLGQFYQLLEDLGFKAHTIGTSQAPLKSPFQDVHRLMKRCQCTIVMGLPQIFVETGSLKDTALIGPTTFATEWNQIEATMSLMLDLPTLVLLHRGVAARGIFDRGAADVFVYEIDALSDDWPQSVRAGLASLKAAVGPTR